MRDSPIFHPVTYEFVVNQEKWEARGVKIGEFLRRTSSYKIILDILEICITSTTELLCESINSAYRCLR